MAVCPGIRSCACVAGIRLGRRKCDWVRGLPRWQDGARYYLVSERLGQVADVVGGGCRIHRDGLLCRCRLIDRPPLRRSGYPRVVDLRTSPTAAKSWNVTGSLERTQVLWAGASRGVCAQSDAAGTTVRRIETLYPGPPWLQHVDAASVPTRRAGKRDLQDTRLVSGAASSPATSPEIFAANLRRLLPTGEPAWLSERYSPNRWLVGQHRAADLSQVHGTGEIVYW